MDAVEAINSAEATNARERLLRLRELLKDIGKVDLAKGLSRIQYSKVSLYYEPIVVRLTNASSLVYSKRTRKAYSSVH